MQSLNPKNEFYGGDFRHFRLMKVGVGVTTFDPETSVLILFVALSRLPKSR